MMNIEQKFLVYVNKITIVVLYSILTGHQIMHLNINTIIRFKETLVCKILLLIGKQGQSNF